MALIQQLKEHISQIPCKHLDHLPSYACVAIILTGASRDELNIGYIQRAIHPSDRWSGQIAFPGGKKEAQDSSDLATALRETYEEIGWQLNPQECLGQLSDIQARNREQMLPFFIRPFVFYCAEVPTLKLDANEVADFFWLPLKELFLDKNKRTYLFKVDGKEFEMKAVEIGREPPLWGLTYLMTQELKGLAK